MRQRSCTMLPVRIERLSFFVESVQVVPEGWRLEGEPGYHPRHWARPGDRFDHACDEHGRQERDVDLVVVELRGSHAFVTGSGGDQLRPDDILSGERVAEHDDPGMPRDRSVRPALRCRSTPATQHAQRLVRTAESRSAAAERQAGSVWCLAGSRPSRAATSPPGGREGAQVRRRPGGGCGVAVRAPPTGLWLRDGLSPLDTLALATFDY